VRRLALVLALFLVLAARSAAEPRRTLLIGSALALSGPLATEGNLTREGYEFWKRYVNARGGLRIGADTYAVDIKYVDDESDPATTARRLESLIVDDHVNFILGPYGTAPTFAAASVVERHRVPMVDSAGAAETIFNQGYRYTFAVLSPARKYLVGIIEFAVRRTPRPQSVAISAASDAFSLEVQQGAVQSANDHGLRVVYSDHYADDPASIAAAATAIKAANPDIVLNAGHVKDALALHQRLKELHVNAKLYGYTNGPDTAEFRSALGNDAQAVLGSAQWSPAVTYTSDSTAFYQTGRAYAAAFAREVGHVPDYHNAQATAAALALQYALQHAGTANNAEAVRNALAKLDVVTFFGLIKFDARGVNLWKPMVVNQIQSGALRTIYPYRLADSQPIYPSP
jgi:branched-chain amino acid transport system substrate-binding protein